MAGLGFIAGIAGLMAAIAPGGPAPGRPSPKDRAPDGPGAAGPGAGPAATAEPAPPPVRADDGAEVVGERYQGSRLLDLAVRSPALDAVGHVRLLLPPGWSRRAARTWPVLWLLHGGGAGRAGHTAWTQHTDVAGLTAGRGVLVVMPDGGPRGHYTDWWNRGEGGPPKWETFHLTEVRQILERGYAAGPERSVAGHGMGGTGALAYAARHRGLFQAAASFSGTPHLLRRDPSRLDAADLVELGAAVDDPGGDWTDVWGDPDDQRAVWRRHNPYDLADRLAGVRLYVGSGDGWPGPHDQPGSRTGVRTEPDVLEALAHRLSVEFAGKLDKLGIPVSAHFYQGTHTWPYWERELREALPVLLGETA
ncbi:MULTISPECIES: alpha/beta hydrolase [Thermomonosporaceae]|uniref:alpha/beta hydrolase n=1 Tax=Thermomonosporaceae TaxID=2012 RepID=UPI00255ABD8D|nr:MULTISPECIES: alpha/beta hydrolase family protein [Thermomonosporaceae]MDL4774664.1 alpha/beta hydrolase family protein [Actinomadura xylanilytica]